MMNTTLVYRLKQINFEEKCNRRYTLLVDNVFSNSTEKQWSDFNKDQKIDHIINFTKINNTLIPIRKKDIKKYYYKNIIFNTKTQMIDNMDITLKHTVL